MLTACFARVLQRCPGRLFIGFRFIFQAVRPIGKTRNQFTTTTPEIGYDFMTAAPFPLRQPGAACAVPSTRAWSPVAPVWSSNRSHSHRL